MIPYLALGDVMYSHRFPGLTNGVTYNLSVRAFSCAGTSDPSWITAVPVPTAPSAPQAVQVAATATSMTVSWLPPLDNGGAGLFAAHDAAMS